MKLQEAYAAEKNEVGTWVQVGYKGLGSNATAESSSTTSTFNYTGPSAGAWSATAKVALNDCVNGTWSVTTSYTTSDGQINTTASTSDDAKCRTALTPSFCNIATSGSCS